jgi:hypothetical protein
MVGNVIWEVTQPLDTDRVLGVLIEVFSGMPDG